MTNDIQIIKCRDDKAPVILNKLPSEAGAEIAFKLAEGKLLPVRCSCGLCPWKFAPRRLC